jgi:hypothetical protein
MATPRAPALDEGGGAPPDATQPRPGPSAPPTSAVRGPTPLPPLPAPTSAAPGGPATAPLPFGADAAAGEGATEGYSPDTEAGRAAFESVADVDVLLDSFDDETRPRYFNWQQRIVDYFHDIGSLHLPDEGLLVGSLPGTPSRVLLQEDAMWNLALCVAFGSDRLADAAAEAFFRAQREQPEVAGIDWITRTLLSRGFLPSGIPPERGSAPSRCCADTARSTCARNSSGSSGLSDQAIPGRVNVPVPRARPREPAVPRRERAAPLVQDRECVASSHWWPALR